LARTAVIGSTMPTQADLDAAGVPRPQYQHDHRHGGRIAVPLLREYGFLQLRMLCELIALGCLVAHGDIEETKAPVLQNEYKAGVIVKRLERLIRISIPLQGNQYLVPATFTWTTTTVSS
jgi:hypothetical protein